MTDPAIDVATHHKELISSAYSKKDITEIWQELKEDRKSVDERQLKELHKLLVQRTNELKCAKPWRKPHTRTS